MKLTPKPRSALAVLFCIVSLHACGVPDSDTSDNQQVLNLYSTRHYDSDKQIYAAFEAKTGIAVRAREAGAAQLLETMKAEGAQSPADVILAADAGTLWRFRDAGLTGAIESPLLNSAIPARLRGANGHWVGLAKRYRVVAYDPARVEPSEIDEMSDLASPRFEGEICVRSSTNIYNLSLLAEIIARQGQDVAESWAGAVRGNFARQPQGGDTEQIKAVAAGACSVAIVNHYYWVRLAQSGSPADREAAQATRLAFASAGAGAHTNVTGAALAANAPHREAGRAFIEFLASPEGQQLLVAETKEFPVVEGVPYPEGLDALAEFAESDLELGVLGENQSQAQMIFDRVGWN